MLDNRMKKEGILEQVRRGLHKVETLLHGDREMEKKVWIRGEIFFKES